MSGLSDYIRDLLKKGYDENSIRSYLVSYGYKQQDINSAFNEVYAEKGISKKPNLFLYIVLIIGFIGFIVLLSLLVVNLFQGGAKVTLPPEIPKAATAGLTANLEITTKDIYPESTLESALELTSETTKQVDLTYVINPAGSEKIVLIKTYSESVIGTKSISKPLKLPKINDGSYSLKVTLETDGKKTYLSKDFKVIPKAAATEQKPKQVIPVQPQQQKAAGEKGPVDIRSIVEIGATDKERALGLCAGLSDITDRESCFSELALKVKDNSLCEGVTNIFIRDSCYANFVLIGDLTVCDKIIDDYNRNICNALAASQQQPQQEQQANQTSANEQ